MAYLHSIPQVLFTGKQNAFHVPMDSAQTQGETLYPNTITGTNLHEHHVPVYIQPAFARLAVCLIFDVFGPA